MTIDGIPLHEMMGSGSCPRLLGSGSRLVGVIRAGRPGLLLGSLGEVGQGGPGFGPDIGARAGRPARNSGKPLQIS